MKIMNNLIVIALLIFSSLISIAADSEGSPVDVLKNGIGCWVQKNSIDNQNIYSDVFGWYVADASFIGSFDNKHNKPLFLSFAGKNADNLIKNMEINRDKIVGAVWDWEFKGTPQEEAEASLKRVYAKAKQLGLLFGLVIQPGVKQNLDNGIDLTQAESYSDFIMPMLYVQWFGMRRGQTERLLNAERRATRIPIIALLTLETTMTTPPRKLTPEEIVSSYKGLETEGFCVWNVKDLDSGYLQALSTLRMSR